MRKIIFHFAILLGLASAAFSQTNLGQGFIEKDSRQMLMVSTADWGKSNGQLQRFERRSAAMPWQLMGSEIKVVLGRNGLGWGRGLHLANKAEPQKKEGDGKSPAGIFRLTSAFGFPPPEEMKFLKLPYLQVTEALECVDDVKSARYNTITDNTRILRPDWTSSEKMLSVGEPYRLGIVVDHNPARVAGRGSCIFIHIAKDDGSGTSGCTAMAKGDLEKVMAWLNLDAKPVLVQLPRGELERLRSEWNLPAEK
ncbi:MAG: L,D-transpeptidase family protein [Verrucomicrobiota bacterium]